MSDPAIPVPCVGCRHLVGFITVPPDLPEGVVMTDAGFAWACAAFMEGIPDAILEGEVDHRSPVDGDHGIQFEPL